MNVLDLNFYRKISLISGSASLLIGVTVIAGWYTHNYELTCLYPSWVAMKVNTALGFILGGAALLFLVFAKYYPKNKTFIYLASFCALALFLMGGLSCIEYAFGVNLFIDELFLKQPAHANDLSAPGRMSPFTAVMQVCYAIAFYFLSSEKKNNLKVSIAQYVAFAGGALGFLTFFGYLLDAQSLYKVGHFTAIAAHTAIGFILISLGILFLEPTVSLMHTFTSPTRTGTILRRFVPMGLFVPAFIGWLRIAGQRVGLYDFQTGLALVVSCWVVSWEMGIFWMSRQFQDIELVLSEREIELSKQADLLNLTQDAIIVRDLEGKIIFWNNGANEMYGYSPEEVKGTISHELLKTKFPTDKNAIQEMILKNSKWEGELTHFTKGNQPVVVSSRWSLKRDRAGNAVEILEINNDISATKEVEERVSEFYSTVSHELRTPLTSIKGSFSLLAGGKVGELSSKGDQLVKIGLAETERLIRLINDILDIKKIEVGKFQLYVENIAPQEFIKQTILSVLGFAEQYGVNLIAEIKNNDTIEGDKDRLIQVLTNLISNAVKFSDPGEAVTIVSSKRDKYIRFSVIDKGPGIDARNVPKLFRMFQQSDSGTAQPKGGSGLGLAVCKSLVEQHGGNIGIDTEVGKGSTFWFEIPCV